MRRTRPLALAALLFVGLLGSSEAGTSRARFSNPRSPADTDMSRNSDGGVMLNAGLSVDGGLDATAVTVSAVSGLTLSAANNTGRIVWSGGNFLGNVNATGRFSTTGGSAGLRTLDIALGTGEVLYVSAAAPTSPVACTAPTITSGGAASFKADVGTACTGVTAFAFTLPAATVAWHCTGRNITTTTAGLRQSGAESATGATMTNYTLTTGATLDFAAGDDLRIACTGG